MSQYFKIRPGKYDVPYVGKVNAYKEVSDETALKLYLLPRRIFPWIKLEGSALDYLAGQDFSTRDVALMVQNSRTEDEARMVASLSEAQAIERILETKIRTF